MLQKLEGEYLMMIRYANENDLLAWCTLATEVSPIFRHPGDMGADMEFISYAKSKVNKHETLTAVDPVSGVNMGFIGFSKTHNRISWFGVFEAYRGKGVGGGLLKAALCELDREKPISVETYPEGYAPGVPAKKLYRKFGFVETESDLTSPHGLPVCKMMADLSAKNMG